MRKTLLATAALIALAAAPAHAAFVVSAALGGAPDNIPGVIKENFDSLTPMAGPFPAVQAPNPVTSIPGMTISFGANSQVAGLPNQSGVFAAPFLSGNNGVGFGSPDQPNGQNSTPYLTAFGGSSITISFADDLKYLGLLWGSVDTYNTLELWLNGVKQTTVTGTAVAALAAVAPTGAQGAGGTIYINIAANHGDKFDEARFISGQPAFEFDNLALAAFVPPGAEPQDVPGPAALGLFGLGLLGLAALRRRR